MEKENRVPTELLYAILIAASLDESSEMYGHPPDWMAELDADDERKT